MNRIRSTPGNRQHFGINGLFANSARNSTVKQLSDSGHMLILNGADFR